MTQELVAKIAYFPAKAGFRNCSKILDSGSRFALNTMRCRASLARNDDFLIGRELLGDWTVTRAGLGIF